jgi:hypothetical protein
MKKRIYLSPPHIGDYEQQFGAEAFASKRGKGEGRMVNEE